MDPLTMSAIMAGTGALSGALANGGKQSANSQASPFFMDRTRDYQDLYNVQAMELQRLLRGETGVGMAQAGMGADGRVSTQAGAGLYTDSDFNRYTDLARSYLQGGGVPTAADTSSAQAYAQSMFNPQRVAMQQAFTDQADRVARLSAQLGRPVNDPILQAKLAQEQTRQSAQLEANQGTFAAQQGYDIMGNKINLAQSLQNQAMQNRLQMMGITQGQIQQNLSAAQAGRNTQTQNELSVGDRLSQAFAGGSAGLRAASFFNQPDAQQIAKQASDDWFYGQEIGVPIGDPIQSPVARPSTPINRALGQPSSGGLTINPNPFQSIPEANATRFSPAEQQYYDAKSKVFTW
jgi:hypothetical protein